MLDEGLNHEVIALNQGIYIEFGYASILLIELGIICLSLAIINIVWAAVKRFRNSQIKNNFA